MKTENCEPGPLSSSRPGSKGVCADPRQGFGSPKQVCCHKDDITSIKEEPKACVSFARDGYSCVPEDQCLDVIDNGGDSNIRQSACKKI